MLSRPSLLLFASTVALASTEYISLFSFGDSYTDTGFDVNGVQPSSVDALGNPAYGTAFSSTTRGTFSGGPNYIDYIVANYNDTLVLSYNFAYGGATITDSIVMTRTPDINTMEEQAEQLWRPKYSSQINGPGGWNPERSIFIIFMGINDIQGSYQNTDPAIRVPDLLDAYFKYVNELYIDGAHKFLFIGVPPFDRSPPYLAKAPEEAELCSRFINDYNGALAQRIGSWGKMHPDADISIYDFHAWMIKVLDSPQNYGLQDATCSGEANSKCVWWEPNNLHTTSTFQNLLAMDMLPSLEKLGY